MLTGEEREKIKEAWRIGQGITETNESLHRAFGYRLEPELIRREFVRLGA